jgi:hypothetical protein
MERERERDRERGEKAVVTVNLFYLGRGKKK